MDEENKIDKSVDEKRLRLRTYQREYMRAYRAKLLELNPKPPKPKKSPSLPKPPKIKKPKKTLEELYKTQLDRQNKKVTCICGCILSHGNMLVHRTSVKHKKKIAELYNEIPE